MLSELCKELRNWFDRNQPHFHGATEIVNGKITNTDFLETIKNDQYFRIAGSVFNDGIYKNTPETVLTDEIFVGTVSLMAIPKEVLTLSNEIDAWVNKYGAVDSANMSPFNSESFGGYSYTKGSSGMASGDSSVTWQSAFASRLNKWRKI